MLQVEGALATWQLACCPDESFGREPIIARKLGDHRTAYLTYEGPVSRDRGHVERMDGGAYELISRQPGRWEIILCGRKVRGKFELRQSGDDPAEWRLTRACD